jgi:hypothetical protein
MIAAGADLGTVKRSKRKSAIKRTCIVGRGLKSS